MSPRERLIEAGVRMVEERGPQALNARRLAAEIGASTMVVYTHFGGMPGVCEALVRELFVRFGQQLTSCSPSSDPVADLLNLGLKYREFALTSPPRYRFMFGVTSDGVERGFTHDLTSEGTPSPISEASATFEPLKSAVRRAMDAGRLTDGDEAAVAGQLWTSLHGFVLLEMAGQFGGHGVQAVLAPMTVNLLVGLGDDRAGAERSLLTVAAEARWAEGAPASTGD